MTEHHLTTTLLIVGHTFAEIPKGVSYLTSSRSPLFTPIYSHFTLPYKLMVKAGPVQPWIEWYLVRSWCWVLVLVLVLVALYPVYLRSASPGRTWPPPATTTCHPHTSSSLPALLFKLSALFRVGARTVNVGWL